MAENLTEIAFEDYDGSTFKYKLGYDPDFGVVITKLSCDEIDGYYYVTAYFDDGRAVNKFLVVDIKQVGWGYHEEDVSE